MLVDQLLQARETWLHPHLLCELQAEQKGGVGDLQVWDLENIGKHGAGGRRR